MSMKKSIIMFTSLLLVALFIGTSMNSAIAADIREVVEDGDFPSGVIELRQPIVVVHPGVVGAQQG